MKSMLTARPVRPVKSAKRKMSLVCRFSIDPTGRVPKPAAEHPKEGPAAVLERRDEAGGRTQGAEQQAR